MQYNWDEVNNCNLQTQTFTLTNEMQECYHTTVNTKTNGADRRNAWFTDELRAIQKEGDAL